MNYLGDSPSFQQRDYIESSDWEAIEWDQPDDYQETIDGMTGRYQVMVSPEQDCWVCDAHTFEEAQFIAAMHKLPNRP
jgi:hypothetical protein